jgi:hypothetical protein
VNDTRAGDDPLPSRRTYLLRGAADGVLTAAERTELEQHLAAHPEDKSVIEFEGELRASLQRTLSGDRAPEHVQQRVLDLARDTSRLRRLSLVRVLAAAAVLLAIGAAFWALRRSNPDQFGFEGRGQLVQFLATHPHECPITVERTIKEFNVHRFDEAVSTLGTLLGDAPLISDLGRTDLQFMGMGRCGIPGHELSMHLQFMGAKGSPLEGAMLSVYVQHDDGRLPIADGTTYQLQPKATDYSALEIYVWKRQGLDYFIVTPNPKAGQIALASVAAPRFTAPL